MESTKKSVGVRFTLPVYADAPRADENGFARLLKSAIHRLACARIFSYPSWQHPGEYESQSGRIVAGPCGFLCGGPVSGIPVYRPMDQDWWNPKAPNNDWDQGWLQAFA